MATKGEKVELVRSINRGLTAAGLPEIPPSCLYSMTIRDLHQFQDQWIGPLCGRLIAGRTTP